MKTVITGFIVVLTVLTPRQAEAALNAYLRLTGLKMGAIAGDVTSKGREGTLVGLEFRHAIISPRDAATGLPSGKRQHAPIVFTTEVGKAQPLLVQALCTNEVLNAEFTFWKPSVSGTEVNYMTIRLTNAHISNVSIRQMNTRDPNLSRLPEMADVEFTYESIEIRNNETGRSFKDTWSLIARAPAAPTTRAAAALNKKNRIRRASR